MEQSASSDNREIRFKLHEKQCQAWRALEDPTKRTIALISGIQGGKTIFGSFATRYMLDQYTEPGTNFIIGAPTYKILEQSTLPTFEKIHKRFLGSYNGKEGRFRLKDGRSVWFRTATDPDSVEGIPDSAFGWVDEAGKCSRRFWLNIQARLARRSGKLLLTTTWYSLNWLFKEIWKPFHQRSRDDIAVISFNSSENPTFPREELERQRLILSPAEFQRKFMGEPGKMEGMVFEAFGDDNWAEPFSVEGLPCYGGIDWGFDHPTAITIRAFPSDGNCYTVSIFKRSGLSVSQVIDVIKSKARLYQVQMFFCGHDRPDMIAELNKAGVRATPYFEGNTKLREVNAGNQKLAELIRTRRYRVFKGIEQAEDLEDEFVSYVWDRKDGEDYGKEKPVSINDDLIAAERYATVGTYHLLEKKQEELKIPARYVHRIDRWDPTDVEQPDSWEAY